MKRAFMSELAIARSLIPSIAGVGLFMFVVLTLANASDVDSGMSAGACAVSAMSPIIIMNSLAGYDNQKRLGALSSNVALLAQRHHLRTLPVHRCLLGHHGLRRRASEHRLHPAFQQCGHPLDGTGRL